MEDLIKKLISTGIEVITHSTEKIQSTVEKLVDERKLSIHEGEQIVEALTQSAASQKKELDLQIGTTVERIVDAFKFANAKELEELKARIEALEEKIGIVGSVESFEKRPQAQRNSI